MPGLWLGEPQIPNSALDSLHCQGAFIVFLFHIFISEVEAILNFVHPGHIHIAWWRLQVAQVSRENVAWKPYNYLWTCELWRLFSCNHTALCSWVGCSLWRVNTSQLSCLYRQSNTWYWNICFQCVFVVLGTVYIYIFVISAVASWPTFYWNVFKAQFSYILCW